MDRTLPTNAVVPFAYAFAGRHAKEQSADAIDIMIFQIKALQPRIAPFELLRLHERIEQPFLGDPVDAANQRSMILFERFKNKTPALEQPIRFRIAITQMFCRELEELPLHIKRADRLAILKIDIPFAGRIA